MTASAYSLWQLVQYMTKLGTIGFGGPVALVGYMHRDLVEERKWISEADYKGGLDAFAAHARTARGSARQLSRLCALRGRRRDGGRRCVRVASLLHGHRARRALDHGHCHRAHLRCNAGAALEGEKVA